VGLGFLIAQPLLLLAGAAAYALGWIYLPDTDFFRHWLDRRNAAATRAAEEKAVADFVRRRDTLLSGLTPSRRERYRDLATVCRNIESASADTPLASPASDPRLRKLDELMWTFLRLLTIEESLERFLETERQDDVPGLVQEAETEVQRLTKEVETLKTPGTTTSEAKQRLLGSRTERLEVLKKRCQRLEQAQENLTLVKSEQERLDQQIKLIRADAVASKNTETLTARIDATVEHLDQTNKWLAEMDEFKDLVSDLPATELRVGFDPPMPPVLAAAPRADTPTPDAPRKTGRVAQAKN
jgi:hypothetical protein